MSELYSRDSGQTDSRLIGKSHSLDDVCRLTGFEASRLRFIEREFAEHFPQSHGGGNAFDAQHIDLFRKIHRLLFDEGQSPFEIRRNLSHDLRRLKIIAVTSGKGGVGKTTVSLNLSIAIAALGQRTLLLDADLGLGNVHVFGGVAPRGSMMDLIDGKQSAVKLLSQGPGGIQVLCGSTGHARLADVAPEMIERLGRELATLGGTFDTLVIDTGAGISAQVTRFLSMADEVVVVTTPNIAATLDAYGVIKVMREESMRGQIHLLVNQAEDEAQAGVVSEKIRACSEKFLKYSPSILGSVMRDPAVEEANQARRPLLVSQPHHPCSVAMARAAAKLYPPAPAAAEPGQQDFETMRVLNRIATTAAA
ncbi:MAG TPA: P-loop NTPase [Chthoniobacteraceae bacterium]|nr:P-loop NTPase [Chthoniobacteraceae bacterium]